MAIVRGDSRVFRCTFDAGKRLNPVLDEFAALRPSARVGKVDATKHRSLAKEHGVSGYPSIRFRSAGESGFKDYKGVRDTEALERLDERLRAPAVSRGLLADVDLGFLTSPDSSDRTLFERVAVDRRHEATFVFVEGLEPGIYLKDGDATQRYDGPLNFPYLKKWIKKHNAPLWNVPLSPGVFRRIGQHRLIVACVIDPDNVSDLPMLASRALASDPSLRETFAGGELDGKRWQDYVETFGVTSLPSLLVIDSKRDRFWILSSDRQGTLRDVAAFLDDVRAGKSAPRYHGIRGFPDRAWLFFLRNPKQVYAGFFALLLLGAATIYFALGPNGEPPKQD